MKENEKFYYRIKHLRNLLNDSRFLKYRKQIFGMLVFAFSNSVLVTPAYALGSETGNEVIEAVQEDTKEFGPGFDAITDSTEETTEESAVTQPSEETITEENLEAEVLEEVVPKESPVIEVPEEVPSQEESEEMSGPGAISSANPVVYRDYSSVISSIWETISEEELRSTMHAYTHMSDSEFAVFRDAIIAESTKTGNKHINELEILKTIYMLSYIPSDVKVQTILSQRGISEAEFRRTMVVVLAESALDATVYWDPYSVATAIDNRTFSGAYGRNGNMYRQAMASGQFVVNTDGRANRFMNVRNVVGYQAGTDAFFLGSYMSMHGYLDFRAAGRDTSRFHAFYPGVGNRFGREFSIDERMHRYAYPGNLEELFVPYFLNSIKQEEDELVLSLTPNA